jgi:hypothetical protein
MRNKVFCYFVFAVILLACSPPTLYANIQNGDFSAGLNGWTVESGNVSDGGGYALFEEHPTEILSTLKQGFKLPDWSSMSLLFDVKMSATVGGEHDPFAWPDAFTASLLDPATMEPLICNPGRTDFFYIDNTNPIITIGTLMLRLDLSGLGGRPAVLYFDLIGSNDGRLTTVRLDNVEIVPEPCSLFLWMIGTGILGFLHRSRLRT